tara:strand:- start:194 stop:631 length:438 start_codon:yes stop_codon:yes gene_type:complete
LRSQQQPRVNLIDTAARCQARRATLHTILPTHTRRRHALTTAAVRGLPGTMTQGLFDVLRLVGRLFLGSEIGGTGKATKRDKSQSRKDRKEAGANDTKLQRKEEMMGFFVVGLLLLLALAGIYATATAGNPSALPESGGGGKKRR